MRQSTTEGSPRPPARADPPTGSSRNCTTWNARPPRTKPPATDRDGRADEDSPRRWRVGSAALGPALQVGV